MIETEDKEIFSYANKCSLSRHVIVPADWSKFSRTQKDARWHIIEQASDLDWWVIHNVLDALVDRVLWIRLFVDD
jgi:hypothetical protein